MAKTTPHPYVGSAGPLIQTFDQFKKAMPANVDASTLKKLSLAPNNESVVLSVLRFLGFLDQDGKKTQLATKIFTTHGDDAFAKAMDSTVKKSYSDLFEHYADDTWLLDRDTLIAFFRATDETSAITGKRQAVTFETLAALSGHREIAIRKSSGKATKKITSKKTTSKSKSKAKAKAPKTKADNTGGLILASDNNVGLTVRIEINLPSQGDQDTYDRIFQSIRKNLLNG